MLETPGRFAITGMLAGVYMGIGVVLMLSTAGPLLEADGGLGKLVSGLVFGVALTLTVFAGADLATSGMMTLPIGSAMGAIAHARGALTLLVTVLLNLLGARMVRSQFRSMLTPVGPRRRTGSTGPSLKRSRRGTRSGPNRPCAGTSPRCGRRSALRGTWFAIDRFCPCWWGRLGGFRPGGGTGTAYRVPPPDRALEPLIAPRRRTVPGSSRLKVSHTGRAGSGTLSGRSPTPWPRRPHLSPSDPRWQMYS